MNKEQIKSKLKQALNSCTYNEDIKSLAIFGSYVNGNPAEQSDVDVLVEFTEESHIGFFEYVQLQRELAQALGIKVDLITPEALSKYIKPKVLKEAELVLQR